MIRHRRRLDMPTVPAEDTEIVTTGEHHESPAPVMSAVAPLGSGRTEILTATMNRTRAEVWARRRATGPSGCIRHQLTPARRLWGRMGAILHFLYGHADFMFDDAASRGADLEVNQVATPIGPRLDPLDHLGP